MTTTETEANTPLDALKELRLRHAEHLDRLEHLAVTELGLPDDNEILDLIADMRRQANRLIADHAPDGSGTVGKWAWQYDDGTPIRHVIRTGPGTITDRWSRDPVSKTVDIEGEQ